MHRALLGLLAATTFGSALGCAPPPPPKPPDTPPTPKSITVANPGGDAADPELAAMKLLERGPWGERRDRKNALRTQLADPRHWRRVRLWGYPTRMSFRFGDEHYGVVSVFYRPANGPDDPESCLRRFLDAQKPLAESFGVHGAETRLVRTLQQGEASSKPMVISIIDASVEGSGETKEYVGALAAYTSWPGTCLLQAFVASAKHKELANRVRERWVAEAAPKLTWNAKLTEAPKFEDR